MNDKCPICLRTTFECSNLGVFYHYLSCNHWMCSTCYGNLTSRNSLLVKPIFSCPLCRSTESSDDSGHLTVDGWTFDMLYDSLLFDESFQNIQEVKSYTDRKMLLSTFRKFVIKTGLDYVVSKFPCVTEKRYVIVVSEKNLGMVCLIYTLQKLIPNLINSLKPILEKYLQISKPYHEYEVLANIGTAVSKDLIIEEDLNKVEFTINEDFSNLNTNNIRLSRENINNYLQSIHKSLNAEIKILFIRYGQCLKTSKKIVLIAYDCKSTDQIFVDENFDFLIPYKIHNINDGHFKYHTVVQGTTIKKWDVEKLRQIEKVIDEVKDLLFKKHPLITAIIPGQKITKNILTNELSIIIIVFRKGFLLEFESELPKMIDQFSVDVQEGFIIPAADFNCIEEDNLNEIYLTEKLSPGCNIGCNIQPKFEQLSREAKPYVILKEKVYKVNLDDTTFEIPPQRSCLLGAYSVDGNYIYGAIHDSNSYHLSIVNNKVTLPNEMCGHPLISNETDPIAITCEKFGDSKLHIKIPEVELPVQVSQVEISEISTSGTAGIFVCDLNDEEQIYLLTNAYVIPCYEITNDTDIQYPSFLTMKRIIEKNLKKIEELKEQYIKYKTNTNSAHLIASLKSNLDNFIKGEFSRILIGYNIGNSNQKYLGLKFNGNTDTFMDARLIKVNDSRDISPYFPDNNSLCDDSVPISDFINIEEVTKYGSKTGRTKGKLIPFGYVGFPGLNSMTEKNCCMNLPFFDCTTDAWKYEYPTPNSLDFPIYRKQILVQSNAKEVLTKPGDSGSVFTTLCDNENKTKAIGLFHSIIFTQYCTYSVASPIEPILKEFNCKLMIKSSFTGSFPQTSFKCQNYLKKLNDILKDLNDL